MVRLFRQFQRLRTTGRCTRHQEVIEGAEEEDWNKNNGLEAVDLVAEEVGAGIETGEGRGI